ncbi:uncharacterized protein STEHIDRAFT_110848 [Stereum hirsutum FP-91666 SS1]|uniref:uncharacterized protein n=1 Tax=Stereum hirsutum (strain FP-91666) TaxID=721885 RepID=UPI000440B708|nr:uncharacterized protein STEHIDRAFT_110848 [Stereum hirsutum FP-91666 SS1]EIM87690.1 hypothetical protein STEHIDRAFT_110848 [Stereum hirsutum FP-91666 SS1]
MWLMLTLLFATERVHLSRDDRTGQASFATALCAAEIFSRELFETGEGNPWSVLDGDDTWVSLSPRGSRRAQREKNDPEQDLRCPSASPAEIRGTNSYISGSNGKNRNADSTRHANDGSRCVYTQSKADQQKQGRRTATADFERKRRGEANERLKHDYSDNEGRIIFERERAEEREERNEVTENANARKSRVLMNVDS